MKLKGNRDHLITNFNTSSAAPAVPTPATPAIDQQRRQFMIGALASLASPLLPACTTTDRWFLGEIRDASHQIAILGGGAAGLMAAYTLKKLKIPFLLFEASHRVGGRVLTLNNFTAQGQNVDLGAEWFYPSQKTLINLSNELRIDFEDQRKSFGTGRFWTGSKEISSKSQIEGLANVEKEFLSRFPKTATEVDTLDQTSIESLIQELKPKAPQWFPQWMQSYCLFRWGVEPQKISSYLFFLELKKRQVLFGMLPENRMRIKGGTQNLIHVLFDQVVGVLPDIAILTQHKWSKVKEINGQFKLTFETPNETKTYSFNRVICAIPYSTLREVDGWDQLKFSDLKKESIKETRYGQNTKIAMSSANSNWPNFLKTDVLWGQFPFQSIWDSSRTYFPPNSFIKNQASQNGILIAQMGGPESLKLSEKSLQIYRKDLKNLLNVELTNILQSHVQNWSEQSFIKGSVSYLEPGQITRWQNNFLTSEYDGRWQMAGEHISAKNRSTLEGALETGLNAAESIAHIVTT